MSSLVYLLVWSVSENPLSDIISPIISPISIRGFLRIKKTNQKVSIGPTVKFQVFAPPLQKLGSVPQK